MNNQTGILFFSRLPAHEAQVKKLFACTQKNERIWQQLYNNSLNAARKTKLPLIICTNDVQEGNTFSEKITTAIEKAFDCGLKHLVVIGSDCPAMSAEEIINAAAQLRNNKQVVAGADHRGGVYLFGISKNAFNSVCFKNFRWQTNELLNDLSNYASDFNFALSQTKLNDIHCYADILHSLQSDYCLTYWRLFIFRLFLNAEKLYTQVYAFLKGNFPVNQFALRAPPCIS